MTYSLRTLSALLLAVFVAAPALASPVASESFTYADGALAANNGGSGWAAGWNAANGVTVSNGSLLINALNSDAAATRQLDHAVGGNVLISFNLTFTGTLQTNDFLGLWFGSSTGPNIGLKANCDGNSGANCPSADLFVRTTGSAGAFSTNITSGQTYELMGLLEKVNGSSVYNRFSLWVDPSEEERSLMTGFDARFSGASSISSFNTIGLRSANLDAGDTLRIDNLSINAVPEPSSFALVGLGLAGVLALRRKAKKA